MQTHALRLTPGNDLRAELETFAKKHNIQAGCILTAVGSLTRANIRYGGKSEGAVTTGNLEIISLVGTLSPDGPHLHLAVADESGKVTAGHMLEGCTIRTTAEIVIGELEGVAFSRAEDPRTGYRELRIEKVE